MAWPYDRNVCIYASERLQRENTRAVKQTHVKGYWAALFLVFCVYKARKMSYRAVKRFDVTTDLSQCTEGGLEFLLLSCLTKRCIAVLQLLCVLMY